MPQAQSTAARRTALVPRRTALALALVGAATVAGEPARAAPPEAFVQALQAALAPAEVVAGGTVFGAPLLSANNAVEPLYFRTPAVIGRLEALVAGAEREVLLQTYEWDDEDEAAQLVLAALLARAERAIAEGGAVGGGPLRLRVVTSAAWPGENALSQACLRAAIEAMGRRADAVGRVSFEWSSYRTSPLAILHTKTVVVDGAHALVMTGNLHTHGGLEGDDVNAGLVLSGPTACALRADWASARAAATLEATSAALPEPTPNAAALEGATATCVGAPGATASVAVLSRPSNWTYWDRGDVNPQARGILAAIDTATARIDLVNPSLSVPALHQALLQAMVSRGVRVRAVLSLQMNRAREHTFFGGDNAEQAERLYRALLVAGGTAAAGRLQVVWASADGKTASPPHGPANVHAKVANFDGQCLLLGSTNWNWLSWNNGRELSVAVAGTDVADTLFSTAFASLWATAAPMCASDLPARHRVAADPVARYLRERPVH